MPDNACECGYRVRETDRHEVVMHDGDPNAYVIYHVICYSCGKEWVE